jgi:NAD(P)-dependent dehydrogenase (short-subunit alcohol dehydrogenase family)
MSLQNKIAVVTGGSRGLGKDMVLSLAKNGLDIVFTYNSQKEAADAVIKQIEALGQKGIALQFDVSDLTTSSISLLTMQASFTIATLKP